MTQQIVDDTLVHRFNDIYRRLDSQDIVNNSSGKIVANLPTAPIDGQDCFYLADSDHGVVWHLKYRVASDSIYKWEFIGGPSLSDTVSNFESEGATTDYVDLRTRGPLVTVPLNGDYDLEFGCRMEGGGGGTGAGIGYMSVSVGGAPAVNADAATVGFLQDTVIDITAMRKVRKLNLNADDVILAKYACSNLGMSIGKVDRYLFVHPVRVG